MCEIVEGIVQLIATLGLAFVLDDALFSGRTTSLGTIRFSNYRGPNPVKWG